MWGHPKNLKLDFLIGISAECFLCLTKIVRPSSNCLYYINFESSFSLNGHYYDVEKNERYRLDMLIGKKIVSAKFIKKDKGDLKLTFDSGDELIIHEDDWPYESYTMITPEGLVVV